jgi:hypothetical protein
VTSPSIARPLKRVYAAWNRFWYAEARPVAMGLFRIIFACCLLDEIETTRTKSTFAVEGGFHLSYVDWITALPREVYDALLTVQYPLVLLILIGLWMRPACLLLLFCQSYIFFADPLNFRNHPYVFILITCALMFSHANQAFSFRSYCRRRFDNASWSDALLGDPRPVTMQRLIQVQVCIAYLFAASHKLHPHYLDGHVLVAQVARDAAYIREFLTHFIASVDLDQFLYKCRDPAFLAWPSRASVAIEILVPLTLWSRYTRPFAIILGLGFHASIWATMHIQVFSIAMMGTYILWLRPSGKTRFSTFVSSRLIPRLERRPAHSAQTPDMKYAPTLALTLLTAAVLASGCNREPVIYEYYDDVETPPSPPADTTSNIAQPVPIRPSDRASVTIASNTNISIATEAGQFLMMVGTNINLPEVLRSEFPRNDQARIVNCLTGPAAIFATYSTLQESSDVFNFYRKSITNMGWSYQGAFSVGGRKMITAQKDQRRLTITFQDELEERIIHVMMSRQQDTEPDTFDSFPTPQ